MSQDFVFGATGAVTDETGSAGKFFVGSGQNWSRVQPDHSGHLGFLEVIAIYKTGTTVSVAAALQFTNDTTDLSSAVVKQVNDFGTSEEIQDPSSNSWSTFDPNDYKYVRPGFIVKVSDGWAFVQVTGNISVWKP